VLNCKKTAKTLRETRAAFVDKSASVSDVERHGKSLMMQPYRRIAA
jgi:hypothetical protein